MTAIRDSLPWSMAFANPYRAPALSLCHPDDRAAQPRPVITARPFIGVLAVLLGAVISTLDSRITTFGLADVRGAVHAGFRRGRLDHHRLHGRPNDDRAGFGLAGRGVRRAPRADDLGCRLRDARISCCRSRPTLGYVLVFQAISGLASGTFIPLTIGFVVQNLPARMVVYGVAAYALNLELSLNIAASIEGWFSDNWSWKWIFWDTALLAPLMLICIHFGMPRRADQPGATEDRRLGWNALRRVGFSLLYAALDQGNRLDWLNSGLINGLLLGGTLLLVAFVVQELTHAAALDQFALRRLWQYAAAVLLVHLVLSFHHPVYRRTSSRNT